MLSEESTSYPHKKSSSKSHVTEGMRGMLNFDTFPTTKPKQQKLKKSEQNLQILNTIGNFDFFGQLRNIGEKGNGRLARTVDRSDADPSQDPLLVGSGTEQCESRQILQSSRTC